MLTMGIVRNDKQKPSGIPLDGFCMAIESERLHSLFFDSCFLTGKGTQVVQFSTTYFTDFVNRDAFDKRRFDRENSLYTLRSQTSYEL